MPRISTAEATVETLLRHGLDTVYALPGLHNDPLFDAFYYAGDRLRVIHPRHEQTAAYMALGAALASGKPQAFAVVPGPGLLNAGAALLTAYGMNAPVIGLVGQIPQADIDRGHGHLHEIHDQLGLMRHVTKWAARIRSPQEAPALVSHAVWQAASGRQRPVALECALDTWAKRAEVTLPDAPLPLPIDPIDPEAVEAAARILGEAERPMLVLGGGAQDASAEVIAIAEMLEAPVSSYRRGRGVIPSSHRLAVDMPVGHRLWKEADAVLAVGTRFFIQNANWGIDDKLKVVRIDIDPDEPDRLRRPDVALIGDAATQLRALIDALPRHNRKRPSRAEEIGRHRAWLADRLSRLEPQASFLRAIRNALPEDGIFVDEVSQIGFASRVALPIEKPRTFLSPGYQDNLGWGFGTALGAKVAMPHRKVLAIAGDGGFLYQVGELATAARHNIAVVVVVFDNGAFGNVRRIQQERYGNRLIASDLENPDFVKLADAFGVASFKATDAGQLEHALHKAFALDAPALVWVPHGDVPSPWDLIMMPRVRG
ncbi:thiamine pyrophosphate-dependent enzyme [Enhydrobacter sp.]|jgi:acetolactate synthase-1/2/3 large subunit|uniref:thiamine pyrophosphate-dependent enzyme n=1 Tax=Enhydrobacter sp. TaxID=1894999 RepID=UPI00262FEC3F|nr:thiamine pyrophosphate-dependent enzyme [Enhydrobacter sp.]WIM13550.1 MAG: Acetolactate synthase large subunit [Enhydrobacter sp.]